MNNSGLAKRITESKFISQLAKDSKQVLNAYRSCSFRSSNIFQGHRSPFLFSTSILMLIIMHIVISRKLSNSFPQNICQCSIKYMYCKLHFYLKHLIFPLITSLATSNKRLSFSQTLARIGLNPSIINKMPKQICQQLKKGSRQEKKQQSIKAFTNKQTQVKYKKISQYRAGKTGAPLVIQLLIYYFDGHKQYLDVQGLFRKSANIEQEMILLRQIEKQDYEYIQTITDPHLIANAIKRFLTNLSQPIIPYNKFYHLMQCPEIKLSQIAQVIHSLNNNSKITLLLLIDFFREKLLPRTSINQMNQSNLSIVMGPCIMRSETPSPKDLAYASRIVNIMRIIFNGFESIFGSKKQRMNFVRQSVWSQEEQDLKQRLGALKEQYQWLQKGKLTQQQQYNLDEADEFLSAFNKK